MRKLIFIFSVFLLFLISCTTSDNTVTETPAEVEVETEKGEAIKTVIIDVFLVSKEISNTSTGIVDGYIEYKYNQDGELIEKKELDFEKKQLTRVENTYNNGIPERTQWFSGETDKPGNYILREFSGLNPVKETSYDIKDIPQSISLYEYDNYGNVTRWTVSSGDNVPMIVTEYVYKDGFKESATFLTPLGEKEGSIEYTWVDGRLKTEKTLDSKGKLKTSVEYDYENGNLIKETYFKNTRKDHTIDYELDDNGSVLTKKHFYKSGNLKAFWTFEYISVKKEVQQ